MLGLFRRLWPRDRSRLIFSFHDGTRTRRADPLAAGGALERECPKYAELLELAVDDAPTVPGPAADDVARQKGEAIAELVRATRAAFGVRPLDEEGGLTEAETLNLFREFLVFLARLADAAGPFDNSPPPASPSP